MDTSQSPNSYSQQPWLNTVEEDNIDFKRYISLFISNWYWFAIAIFISLSIAYGINRWSEKLYTISATLLIKDDPSNALTDIFPGSQGFRNQQNVSNEIGILKSFKLNSRVIEKLPEFNIVYTSVGKRGIAETRMYKTCPFIVITDSINKQRHGQKINIKILSEDKYKLEIENGINISKELSFGDRFNEGGFDFVIRLRDPDFSYNENLSNKYYFYFISSSSLANQYRSKLNIAAIQEEASLVSLSTTGYVIQQEVDYLNTLMDVYLDFGLEHKNQTAAQTIDFIENQLLTISDSLKLAENELENFRLYNQLIDLSREGTIIQNNLEQIDKERTELIIQKNYYSYLLNYVESRDDSIDIIAPSIMGIDDPLLVRLINEFSQLQSEKRQLSVNLNETSVPLKVIEESISDTRQALSENIKSGIQNLDQLLSDVDKRILNIENEIRKLPTTERQMINIQRKFDINNTVYTFLLEKRAEAGIAKASNVPDNRIIDNAGYYSSSRIRPREKRNLMIATLLGLMVPFIIIILIDYLNNKIIDKKDVERKTNVPVLGYISHNSMKTDIPVAENPGSTLSESFRSVRTNLKYFFRDINCPVISVSSTIISEGKTFVSTNLAAIIALTGKRVLLVGLDLRKPRIHRIFGIDNEEGISNLLIGEKKFDEIIRKTEVDNLWYAPSGPVPPNPAELIESEAMEGFFKKAKERFDFIIVDTPPVAIVTDALLVSSFTDFYLFVVRQRYSSKNTLDLINELNDNESINNLGIVINDISMSGYYGYGLRYGYSMGYGYNYGYNYYSHYGKYGYADSAKGYYQDEE